MVTLWMPKTERNSITNLVNHKLITYAIVSNITRMTVTGGQYQSQLPLGIQEVISFRVVMSITQAKTNYKQIMNNCAI